MSGGKHASFKGKTQKCRISQFCQGRRWCTNKLHSEMSKSLYTQWNQTLDLIIFRLNFRAKQGKQFGLMAKPKRDQKVLNVSIGGSNKYQFFFTLFLTLYIEWAASQSFYGGHTLSCLCLTRIPQDPFCLVASHKTRRDWLLFLPCSSSVNQSFFWSTSQGKTSLLGIKVIICIFCIF